MILDRVARRREWHRKYIDYRALAEGLRVQHYWYRAGVAAAGSIAFAHDNFMQKQDVELGWIRNVMRAAGVNAPDREGVDKRRTGRRVEEWIGAPSRGGQLGYYSRRSESRARVHRTTRVSAWPACGSASASRSPWPGSRENSIQTSPRA